MTKAVKLPGNLPYIPSNFVGREREIARINQALGDPDVDIVSIYDLAGMGKTTLARFVVEQQRNTDRFPGGIIWIDCSIEDSLWVSLPIPAKWFIPEKFEAAD